MSDHKEGVVVQLFAPKAETDSEPPVTGVGHQPKRRWWVRLDYLLSCISYYTVVEPDEDKLKRLKTILHETGVGKSWADSDADMAEFILDHDRAAVIGHFLAMNGKGNKPRS